MATHRRSGRRRAAPVLVAAGIVAVRVAAGTPALAAPGDLTLVSGPSAEGPANSGSTIGRSGLSADGTRVAFHSYSSDLVAGDTNGSADVFVKDLTTGQITLASTSDTGAAANGESQWASISADGTRVAFTSYATNLGEGDVNNLADVYVKDLTTGALTLASTSDSGATANDMSLVPSLSADGTRVAFMSYASNFGEGDTDGETDVYVKDLTTGALALASTSDSGTTGSGHSGGNGPAISAEGTRVAFASNASDLGEGDTDATIDIFVKDLTTGALSLASTSDTGTKGNGQSQTPSLSADGTRVSFSSMASNLGDGDTDALQDIFVKDLATGALHLASTSDTGVKGERSSMEPVLSLGGTRVSFRSDASAFGALDLADDIFVKDLVTGALSIVSTSDDGTAANTTCFSGSLSEDGTRVAFMSFANNLDEGDTKDDGDVYLKEVPGPATPTASADVYSTSEDTALTVAAPGVLANDTDADAGDFLRASVVSGPAHGTLSLAAGGGFTYTPSANYAGPDSFTYRASDGSNGSPPATVSLTVEALNDVPVAAAGADQTVAHDADFTLSGGGTDADGDGLTYAWTQVSGPAAVIRDPDAAETVVDGVPGAATLVFRLTVTDPSGATSSDEITVTVNPK